jgi:hypothetical protein
MKGDWHEFLPEAGFLSQRPKPRVGARATAASFRSEEFDESDPRIRTLDRHRRIHSEQARVHGYSGGEEKAEALQASKFKTEHIQQYPRVPILATSRPRPVCEAPQAILATFAIRVKSQAHQPKQRGLVAFLLHDRGPIGIGFFQIALNGGQIPYEENLENPNSPAAGGPSPNGAHAKMAS